MLAALPLTPWPVGVELGDLDVCKIRKAEIWGAGGAHPAGGTLLQQRLCRGAASLGDRAPCAGRGTARSWVGASAGSSSRNRSIDWAGAAPAQGALCPLAVCSWCGGGGHGDTRAGLAAWCWRGSAGQCSRESLPARRVAVGAPVVEQLVASVAQRVGGHELPGLQGSASLPARRERLWGGTFLHAVAASTILPALRPGILRWREGGRVPVPCASGGALPRGPGTQCY